MIKVNKNILGLKPSSTLAINQRIRQIRNEGKVVTHFGFGQSPFPIHNSITSSLVNHVNNNSYLPTIGLEALRKEISSFLEIHQEVKSESDFLFIGPGSKELLYQTILILEGKFIIPKGSWVSYLPQIKTKNGGYQVLETYFEDSFKLSAKTLDDYCNENPDIQKTLILNSPNNPTGAVYNDDELKALSVVCEKHDIIVLSDEIYSQINFKNQFSPSISKYYPEKTIVFGGLSKVFSAGGYRLGFMALPPELYHLKSTFRSLFSETFSAVASPIQFAAIKAYNYNNDLRLYVNECASLLKLVADIIYERLTDAGIECTKPEGAFYMMIGFNKFKELLNSKGIVGSNQLAEYLLDEYQVALLPSTDFYFEEEELFFRLAFVDFEGEVVLNAIQTFEGSSEAFVETHCTSVNRGINQLIKFVNDLK